MSLVYEQGRSSLMINRVDICIYLEKVKQKTRHIESGPLASIASFCFLSRCSPESYEISIQSRLNFIVIP